MPNYETGFEARQPGDHLLLRLGRLLALPIRRPKGRYYAVTGAMAEGRNPRSGKPRSRVVEGLRWRGLRFGSVESGPAII